MGRIRRLQTPGPKLDRTFEAMSFGRGTRDLTPGQHGQIIAPTTTFQTDHNQSAMASPERTVGRDLELATIRAFLDEPRGRLA
jgi:hypothetical protein